MCELVMAERALTIVTRGSKAHRRVKAGTMLCADDPLVKGREKLFTPVRVQHYCKQGRKEDKVVEQATAAPGERRTVTLPQQQADDGPQRPPTSGPGSGVDAWRAYAAAVTEQSADDLAELSRVELIELAG